MLIWVLPRRSASFYDQNVPLSCYVSSCWGVAVLRTLKGALLKLVPPVGVILPLTNGVVLKALSESHTWILCIQGELSLGPRRRMS